MPVSSFLAIDVTDLRLNTDLALVYLTDREKEDHHHYSSFDSDSSRCVSAPFTPPQLLSES